MTKRTQISRRALLATAAVSTAAPAQQSPAAGTEIEAARRQGQSDYEQMRKVPLPIAVEPATVFKP